jgi:choline transport protein
LVGSLIQTMILVMDENYGFPAWHGSLLAIFAMFLALLANVYGSKALPYWQNAVFAVHVLAYFGYIIPIWVSSPTATHAQVWADFSNEGGWNGLGLAVLVGQLSGISQNVGNDTAAHMNEEVRNAGKAIPKAMMYIYIVNFLLIFPAIVTVAYHIPNLDVALNDPTTYPAIYVMRGAMSPAWITVMLLIICLINITSNIVYLAAVTSDLFAFSRDRGMP